MKIRIMLLLLVTFALAAFTTGILVRKPHQKKPNPATAWNPKPDATNSMDLIFAMPKGKRNTGWCSNDAKSWWPARADSKCYEDDQKFGTCEFPSIDEPWCNDGNGGAEDETPPIDQKVNPTAFVRIQGDSPCQSAKLYYDGVLVDEEPHCTLLMQPIMPSALDDITRREFTDTDIRDQKPED